MRIAIAGFQHETNTFAPMRATFEEFVKHDAWPGLTRGTAVLDAFAGLNVPIAGFMQAARAAGQELAPSLWCSAEPCSFVTRDAFERITGMLCEDLAASEPFDAVYLDLHGAMVTEHFEDAEGEILRRVREVTGTGVPPYEGRFRVAALGEGRFACTGEMYRGTRTALGPMALLEVDDPACDVKVAVGSERFQCLDQAIFRHLGVEPAEQRILVVKSTIHFRADFDPIAARTLLAAAPGAHPCTLRDLDYRNLRPGVRLEPCGPRAPPPGRPRPRVSRTPNGCHGAGFRNPGPAHAGRS